MSRADTASYLGLSAEAVTRACAKMQKTGIVGFTGTHTARILNRGKFDHLVAGHHQRCAARRERADPLHDHS